jgi:protein SCO1/2
MKPKIILSALAALTLLTVLSVIAFSRRHQPTDDLPAGAQTFEVRGQVRSLDLANRTARIAHEEIPDYMPAMTMPFTFKDAALFKGLAVGDNVRFRLVVTENDSWISRIEKGATDGSPSLATATKTATSVQDRETEHLGTGEAVPDFQLIDQNSRPIRLSDFRGKAVVLTFIYTRCPIPNFCPLMSKNFAELQGRLEKEFSGRFHLLSVSIDPSFDRPGVLKEYASRHGAEAQRWTFATGDEEQINFVAGLMGLFHEPENGLISHDLRTALIGPDGRLVHLWKSNVWTPYEVHRRVGESLSGTKDYAVAP